MHFDPPGEAAMRKMVSATISALRRSTIKIIKRLAMTKMDGKRPGLSDDTATKYLSTTFGEAIASGRWGIFAARVDIVTRLVRPLVILFSGVTTWLLAEVASGHNILRLAQVTLILGFIISAILFVNFTLSFRRVQIFTGTPFQGDPFFQTPTLDDEVQAEVTKELQDQAPTVEEEIKELDGTMFYPTPDIDDNYVDLVRRLFTRQFFVGSCSNALLVVILLLVQWPFPSHSPIGLHLLSQLGHGRCSLVNYLFRLGWWPRCLWLSSFYRNCSVFMQLS